MWCFSKNRSDTWNLHEEKYYLNKRIFKKRWQTLLMVLLSAHWPLRTGNGDAASKDKMTNKFEVFVSHVDAIFRGWKFSTVFTTVSPACVIWSTVIASSSSSRELLPLFHTFQRLFNFVFPHSRDFSNTYAYFIPWLNIRDIWFTVELFSDCDDFVFIVFRKLFSVKFNGVCPLWFRGSMPWFPSAVSQRFLSLL